LLDPTAKASCKPIQFRIHLSHLHCNTFVGSSLPEIA